MASGCKLLTGKTAVITGCNRGIGKAILELFASHGANIFACVRREDAGFSEFTCRLAETWAVKIVPICFDMAKPDEIKSAAKQIAAFKKPVDVLVNNAGIGYSALFQMTPANNLKEVFEVNFFGPFLFTQYLVKLMARRKSGNISNIASTAAIDGNTGKAAYGASKAALICFTSVISSELASSGIRANAIAPGMTDTDILVCLPEEVIQGNCQAGGTKKIMKPSEIADTALFLASDLSAHISGQVIRVDGGLL